jgi:hypothetical protein
MASRGAKPMLCTKPSNWASAADRSVNRRSIWASSADIAIEDQRRAEIGGKLGDAVLEALAHIAEGQFGALRMAGLGNAVGDRAVAQHAGDQQFFASRKTHKSLTKNPVQNCRMRKLLAGLLSGSVRRRCGRRTAMRCGATSSTRRASAHFDYVNPLHPRGRIAPGQQPAVSTFDKYNPFTMKGNAPAYLSGLMFDSLLAGSLDETGVRLRPAGRDVEVAPTA